MVSSKGFFGVNFASVPSLPDTYLFFSSRASWWFLVPADELSLSPAALGQHLDLLLALQPPFGFIQPSCRSRAEGAARAPAVGWGAGEQVLGGDWATNASARFPSQNPVRPSHLIHRDLLSPLKDIFPFSFSTPGPLILSPSVTMMIAAEQGENTTA